MLRLTNSTEKFLKNLHTACYNFECHHRVLSIGEGTKTDSMNLSRVNDHLGPRSGWLGFFRQRRQKDKGTAVPKSLRVEPGAKHPV
jgi:hypothetical protein